MSERQDKMSTLLTHAVAAYVVREANPDPLITITRATISPDLRNATVYYTTLPEGREKDAQIFLHRSAKDMRHSIMKHNRLKIMPHLDFMLDVGERHRQHIDELVRESGVESTLPDTELKG